MSEDKVSKTAKSRYNIVNVKNEIIGELIWLLLRSLFPITTFLNIHFPTAIFAHFCPPDFLIPYS